MKKIFYKTVYTLVILSFCFFTNATQAQDDTKIYAIICGGTSITDIGSGAQESVDLMEQVLDVVSNYTGMEVETTLLTGSNFTKSKIVSAIDALNPSDDDVVLFYSTSHGFNYKDKPSEFAFIAAHPTLTVMDENEFNEYALSLEYDVYDELMKKGARLTITMAEACNNVIDLPAPNRYKKMKTLEANRLKELFLDTQGSVISCSSELDTYSYTDLDNGGFYTNMFLIALNEVVTASETATWQEVFNKTGEKTNKYAIDNAQTKQKPKSIVDTPMQFKKSKENKTEENKEDKNQPKKKSGYKASGLYQDGPFKANVNNKKQ